MDTVGLFMAFAIAGLVARAYLKAKLKQMADSLPEREHPID